MKMKGEKVVVILKTPIKEVLMKALAKKRSVSMPDDGFPLFSKFQDIVTRKRNGEEVDTDTLALLVTPIQAFSNEMDIGTNNLTAMTILFMTSTREV